MKKHLLIIPAITIMLFSSSIKAMPFCPPMDFCPMIDGLDQMGSIFTNVTDLGTQVQSLGNQVISDANNLFSATKSMFSGNISLFAGKAGGGGGQTSGERGMENCVYLGKEYKNTSSEDVFDLIQLLLFRYPSNSILDMQSYDTRRENFYVDNLLEIYTAIRELETEMNDVVGPKLDETIACITGDADKCGIGSPDASNDATFVVGKAFEAVDKFYELLLKITALKAQYTAIKAIRDIKPLNYIDTDSEEQASLNEDSEFVIATSLSKQEELLFAQVSQDNPESEDSLKNALAEEAEKAAAQAKEAEDMSVPDGVVGFVIAKDSPAEHAYVSVADQMEELNKIAPLEEKISGAREVHNLLNGLSAYKHAAESVKETRLRHQAALEALQLSEQCTSNYVCSYFNNTTSSSCKEICFGKDGESGILGWAIQYHEAAKAAETSTDSSDVQIPDVDYESATENADVYDADNTEANKVLSKEESNVNSASNAEKQAEEARRAKMLVWKIGAEASKLLAADPSKWGKNAKSLDRLTWNDEKSFYKQYLTKKYKNIKDYLRIFTIADVLNVIASYLENNPIGLPETPYQQKRAELMAQLEKDLESLMSSSVIDSGLQKLQDKRDSVAQKLENLNAELKEILDELSVVRDKAQEDAGQSMLDNVNYVEAFPSSIDDPTPQSTPIVGVASTETLSTQFTSQSQSNKADLGVDELNEKAEELRAEIAELDEQLQNLDDDIREYKLDMQDADSTANAELNKKKQDLFDKVADTLSAEESNAKKQVSSRFEPIINNLLGKKSNPLIVLEMYELLAKVANTALSDSYAKMDAIIDNTLKRLLNMGDALYNPKNHSKIVEIHQQMLVEIEGLVMNISGVGILPAINNIVIFSKIAEANSDPETDDYFVGSPAKSRDMKAPMVMFEQHLPNVREVVYFDSTDFQNVKPITKRRQRKNKPIKAKDFLNYGGEIPTVWKYLLRDYAFVETKISLGDILSIGCERETFFRQGTLPCKINNVAVDINNKGEYAAIGNSTDLYKCAGITVKKNKLYHGALDVNVRTGERTAEPNCKYSELGVLLAVDDGKLMFRDEVYDAFYTLWAEENNKKDSNSHKKDLASVELAPFIRNQIGDYLFHKENEQTMKEQKEETEESYKTKIQELFSTMSNYGYELADGQKPEDVDLSDDNIYKGIRSSLDDIKTELIIASENLQAEIKISSDNKVVKERVDTLKNIIARLKQDKDELVNIGDDVGSKEDLDARIKSAKANKDTADTHEKAWESVTNSSAIEAPYCANY